ncbi:MAG: transporter substrate-binding domain-containing protein [Aquimonas sp.]|nr:transporter substrate-binding domain-containing protein [Aquimonas sp.]
MFRPQLSLLIWLCLMITASDPAAALDRGDTRAAHRESGSARLQVLWVASEGWAGSDAEGHPQGLAVELMQRFAGWLEEAHGISVSLDFVEERSWRRFYGRIREAEGGVFGLGNVTITETRRQELAFSPPYVDNIAVLASHAGLAQLQDPADLATHFEGRRALGFAGTLHESRLAALAKAYWPDMPLDAAGSNDEILAALAADTHFGYLDAYVFHRAQARGLPVRRHSALDARDEQFGIIMPLDNDWQGLLAEFFALDDGLMQAPWYREAMARHLGPELAELLLP